MLSPEPKRALYGYMAGAGFAIVVFSAFSGLSFPIVVFAGVCVAMICGILIVIPVYALLSRLEQIRPWWASLLGASMMIWVIDWGVPLSIGLGALGGLVGWVVAYGFRLRPDPPTKDTLAVFD